MTDPHDPITATPDFPGQKDQYGDYLLPPQYGNTGLTKREYFAAMAMQGYLSGGTYSGNLQNERLAEESICVADTLIAELNKEPSK